MGVEVGAIIELPSTFFALMEAVFQSFLEEHAVFFNIRADLNIAPVFTDVHVEVRAVHELVGLVFG